jgi:uncharacterized protein YcnI
VGIPTTPDSVSVVSAVRTPENRMSAVRGPVIAPALAVAIAAAIAAAVTTTPTASAHVTASARSPVQGESTVVTLTVPTESEKASTVGLDVALPDEAALTSVRVRPVDGWRADIVRGGSGNTPTAVRWEATDGGAGPDEFVRFDLSVGPLPTRDSLALPAVQHYSDGTQAEWTQQVSGDIEVDHPAPTIDLLPAGSDARPDAGGADRASAPGDSGDDDNVASGPLPWIALGLAATALAVAAVAVVVLVVQLRRTRALTRRR